MSNTSIQNGYYLNKSGDRVNELLSRHFIVPTLQEPPNENTLYWEDDTYIISFRIGEFCKVLKNNSFVFYRLCNIIENKALWKEVILDHQDVSNKQDKLQSGVNIKTINGQSLLGEGNINIEGGGGGTGNSEVIILTQSEYDSLVENNSIIDTSIYFIKDGDTPVALYIGLILIAQKDELGNISFPYNFPIIF